MSRVIDPPADTAVQPEVRTVRARLTAMPWVVLMCKFSDVPEEPQDTAFFQRLFTQDGEGEGGLFDYWRDNSSGTVTLAGSKVHGWFDLPVSRATALSWTWPGARIDLMRACMAAADADVDFRPFVGIIAVLNAQLDSGSAGRWTLPADGTSKTFGLVNLDPLAWFPTFAAHEMGHGFGLPHSFRGSPAVQEYGDGWDVMSAMTFGGGSPVYPAPLGTSGPALCGAYRDLLGWVPSGQQVELNSLGPGVTLTLSALEGGPPGTTLLRVRLGFSTHYYAVEFRLPRRWDAGLARPGVLVRRVEQGRSYLHQSRSDVYDMQAGDYFADPDENLMVAVLGIDPEAGTALVHVGPLTGDAPLTTATLTPLPNAAGWNNSDITVKLSAASAPGGQVREVATSATGAHPLRPATTPGSSVAFPVTRDGRTTVVYAARDVSGTSERPRTLEVRLDKVRPTSRGTVSTPSPGVVDVELEASDQPALSGFRALHYEAVGADPVPATETPRTRARLRITAAGPTTVFFWATDRADNVEGPHTLTFRPRPDVTPSGLAFVAAPGTVSEPVTLTVRNLGETTLNITSTLTSDDRFEIRPGTTLPCGPTLAPGGACTVEVVFAPLAAGVVTGSLFISTNASLTPIEVALTGTGAHPRLEFGVPALTFPITPIGSTSTPVTASVRNAGPVPLTITRIAAGDDYVVTGDGCGPFPRRLQPGESCSVDVAFRPRGPGHRPGGLSVTSDALGGPHLLPLDGEGVAVPELSPDPATLLFRPQPLGTAGAPMRVTLTNTGTADVRISGAATGGPAGGDFTVTGGSCLRAPVAVIPPEQSCEVAVAFRPSALGTRVAELSLATNIAGPAATIPLLGEGVPAPVVTLDPTSIAFPARAVGTTAPAVTVTLTNHGQAALDIRGSGLAGSAPGDFAIAGDTCSGNSVPAGGTCDVAVSFMPLEVGARSATLEVTDTAGARYSAALSGTGSGALLAWDPPSIDFGGLQVGNVERRDATVLNTGNAPLTVTAVSVSGDFTHGQGCQFPVAPGSYCRLRVVFRPAADGPRSGELIVASDALGGPHRLPLTGVGLRPGIGLSAVEIDFGAQATGTAGPAQHLVISSTGTAPLSINEVAASGAHPGDFRIQDACGWRGHMPGSTCAVELAFAPSSPGPRTAALVIRDNAPGAPHTVTLTGTGV